VNSVDPKSFCFGVGGVVNWPAGVYEIGVSGVVLVRVCSPVCARHG